MKNKRRFITSFYSFIFVLFSASAFAQKKNLLFIDSVDRAFDMSDYLIEAHAFIPVPIIITEPALGGFGVATHNSRLTTHHFTVKV
jgi:hypothetical protein